MNSEPSEPSSPAKSPPRARPIAPAGSLPSIPKPKPLPLALVIVVGSLIGALLVGLGTVGLQHYGVGVFVILPLIIAFGVTGAYNQHREWNLWKTLGVVASTFTGIAIWLLLLRIEGLYCIVLAAILSSPFLVLGVLLARVIANKRALDRFRSSNTRFHSLALCLIPACMALETSLKPGVPVLEQTTSIEINAPPDIVWRYIPAFPKIESPPDKMLAMGLAYPIMAEMDGEGVGAKRRCVLSTGAMPEVITVWEPGRCLEFEVLETPPAMEETNPFGKVEAPHTEGYFVCKKGRFMLTALPGGRTRVDGTSWFLHDLWPQSYWAPLTREVVHEVHERVLLHVKALAEASK